MSADPFFRMVVEDVFSIAKRGTVVTGRIEAGTLKVGDEILIRRKGSGMKTVVAGIEAFRKLLDQANQGDTVGILLKDVGKQDVQKGDEIVSAAAGFLDTDPSLTP
ncbi:MAG TPA: EF-Tu/IF-2/RF-3 family GTPase [Anaerolineales bacterium]